MSGPYASGSTQPLETTCSNCGQVSPPGMSFCSRCGKPLAVAPTYATPPAAYPPQPAQQAQPYYPPPTQPMPQYRPEYPSYQQPQAQYGAPQPPMQPPYPIYAQAGPMVVTRPRKSVFIGFLLALLFGPLGLFYSTVVGGIIMLVVSAGTWCYFYTRVVGSLDYYDPGFTSSGISWFSTLPLGIWLGVTLVCVVWSIVAVNSYNNKLLTGQIR